MLPCLNKKLFGIDCLGCGMQRALLFVFKGEFGTAFQMYPAIFPLLLLLSIVSINFFVKFKYDWYIKLSLVIITALTMIISYFIKMQIFFN